ncbi:type II toxin-antitoxin system HigA family antitoxin [Tychonema sp. LEGE 07203]|uniref:helix-turn-helix domain-containing protein n=1 Tax=Tychonema sp. LEGE 07203 TaxID=1828671 RepID=UPI00187FD4C4|nr:transcriptional regulator [Tychonema sp. LEGE 07203]MBE9095950.1 transcriptional regulator [Tychonema sp. LEGE 07203]
MTTGLKSPSSYYLEIITTFPPRPITCEAELIATQNRIDSIVSRSNLTQDDRDYLNLLGTLVYDYEQKHEPMPDLKGIALLKALMVEDNIQEKDLVDIFESESWVSEVMNGKREFTATQIPKLAKFFHLSPVAFLEYN